MLGRTPSDVISESKKLLVLLSNKLFTAGAFSVLLSGGLKIEAFQLQFQIQLNSNPTAFEVKHQVQTWEHRKYF